MEILKKLFFYWELEAWANVLQIIGFLFGMGAFFVSLFIKSEINKLKTGYIFDKRIKKHIEQLKISATNFNQFLNDYDQNKSEIRSEFNICIAELEDLISKISYVQGRKCRKLISFLKSRRIKQFVNKKQSKSSLISYISKYIRRLYETTYDDVWIVYDRLLEIIRQIENIKLNKNKSL